jgi:hypothetical protein
MAERTTGSPAPRPMTGSPAPQEIPPSTPMSAAPRGATHAIRLHYASGWDTYGTYPSRAEAMDAYAALRHAGVPASNIIVYRI